MSGMGTDWKEKLWNREGWEGGGDLGHPPPPKKKKKKKKITPKDQTLCNLRLSRGTFSENINQLFRSSPPPTGTTSVTTRWRPPHTRTTHPLPHFRTSNDWSPPQAPSNSSAHSPLVASKPKIRSYEVWNQDQELQRNELPRADAVQAFFFFFFFYLLTDFHFQLNWSSFVKWPSSYCRQQDQMCGQRQSSYIHTKLYGSPVIYTPNSTAVQLHTRQTLRQSSYIHTKLYGSPVTYTPNSTAVQLHTSQTLRQSSYIHAKLYGSPVTYTPNSTAVQLHTHQTLRQQGGTGEDSHI